MTVAVPALAVENLTKLFGGVKAVDGVSFTVPPGSIHALIGPNGAGKSTIFNLVTNVYPPSSGEVHLFGEPLTGITGAGIARRGLVRTFQTARVFPGMTALENVMSGAAMHVRSSAVAQMLRLPSAVRENAAIRSRAQALLDLVGLQPFGDAAATDLPMGSQKLLEVARALLAKPRLLLLDEPAAGLNDSETRELAALLRAIRAAGNTILIVEHNMSLVMGVADAVVVLDAGALVAAGTPAQIRDDEKVIEAYMGSSGAAHA